MPGLPIYLRCCLAAIALACGCLAGRLSAEDGWLDSNGVRLRYSVQGEGEPVVLIHGFAGNQWVQWRLPGITAALADGYQVIAYDSRGHGLSGKPHDPRQYGLEMVEDAVRLLDHLDVDRAHVVGYSMGGFVACKLLTLHPERMITATLGGAGWSKADDDRAGFMIDLAESLDRGEGLGPLLVRLTPAGERPPAPDRLQALNQLLKLTNDSKALAAAARGMQQLTVTEDELRANQVPTLAIAGELDPFKVTIDEMDGVMSNLKIEVIDGADHMDAFSRPQFARQIKQFLAEHPSASAGEKPQSQPAELEQAAGPAEAMP